MGHQFVYMLYSLKADVFVSKYLNSAWFMVNIVKYTNIKWGPQFYLRSQHTTKTKNLKVIKKKTIKVIESLLIMALVCFYFAIKYKIYDS